MSKYKEKWEPFARNELFWREVLVGRTIKDIKWDTCLDNNPKGRLDRIILDNGEEFWISERGVIGIMDGKDDSKTTHP